MGLLRKDKCTDKASMLQSPVLDGAGGRASIRTLTNLLSVLHSLRFGCFLNFSHAFYDSFLHCWHIVGAQ